MPAFGAVKTFTLLAGTYTSFINTYKFTVGPDSHNLTLYKQNNATENSSWISRHPLDKTLLFATGESHPGFVVSYKIDKNGLVKQLDSAESHGDDPAHLLILSNGREVIVPNYTSGNVQSHLLSKNYTTFVGASPILQFNGSGPDPARQASAHPHQAVEYSSEVLIPDLGSDKVWRLVKEGESWVPKSFIQQPVGSGPRHIIPLDGSLYTLHELSNTLAQQKLAPLGKSAPATLIANISSLPSGVPPNSTFGAAELLISPSKGGSNKQQRYLYASNRNVSPSPASLDQRGDTIAVFELYPKLRLVKHIYTGLQQIRGLQIGGPNGEYLAAAGKEGGGIVIYERQDGDLQELARYNGTGTTEVVSFVWL